jgi:hypothetical protein
MKYEREGTGLLRYQKPIWKPYERGPAGCPGAATNETLLYETHINEGLGIVSVPAAHVETRDCFRTRNPHESHMDEGEGAAPVPETYMKSTMEDGQGATPVPETGAPMHEGRSGTGTGAHIAISRSFAKRLIKRMGPIENIIKLWLRSVSFGTQAIPSNKGDTAI